MERKDDIKPNNTFSRNSLFSTDETKVKKRAQKEKQTTLKVSETGFLDIKSLMLLTDTNNASEMLSILLEHYQTDLSIDEIAEFKQIKKDLEKIDNL
ncbi:replication and copy control-associated protein [Leuconostoc suionicum]|nr:replication and copy control-associated protein [Leuconostoc suionicum]